MKIIDKSSRVEVMDSMCEMEVRVIHMGSSPVEAWIAAHGNYYTVMSPSEPDFIVSPVELSAAGDKVVAIGCELRSMQWLLAHYRTMKTISLVRHDSTLIATGNRVEASLIGGICQLYGGEEHTGTVFADDVDMVLVGDHATIVLKES